jgi:hypothetical protein
MEDCPVMRCPGASSKRSTATEIACAVAGLATEHLTIAPSHPLASGGEQSMCQMADAENQ